MKKKIIWTIVGIFVVFFVFRLLEGTKKLPGINYIIFDDAGDASLCYYEGNREGGLIVTRKSSLYKVLWDKKYIIAYTASPYKSTDKTYYIIEQLETDTFVVWGGKEIPWTSYHSEPWITEEFESYDDFNSRLRELKIDTTQMQCYTWKYWVGIY